MGFKEYTSVAPSTKNKVGFRLDGRDFVCLDTTPGEIWDGLNNPNVEMGTVIEFIIGCIADDKDQIAFRSLLAKRDKIVPLETLTEICLDLIEQYTGRPLAPSSDSFAGSNNGEPTSTGDLSIVE